MVASPDIPATVPLAESRTVESRPHVYTHVFTASHDDVDENGHISNIAYVRWMQDAAIAHSTANGFGWDQMQVTGGTFVVRNHNITYLRGSYGGDPIEIETFVESARAATAVRQYTMRGKGGVELARATTQIVWVSMEGHRPRRIPNAILKAFGLPQRDD